MRFKITLSYEGAPFCGWQIQNNAPSVQGELERALSILVGESVRVTGAGRTDTGVNAIGYVAHFDCGVSWPAYPVSGGNSGTASTERGNRFSGGIPPLVGKSSLTPDAFALKLNAFLPHGIVIHGIETAPDDFHARFSAVGRQYKYFIHRQKNPFLDKFSWHCGHHLDIESMNRACLLLEGRHNCRCFEKTGSNENSGICDIRHAGWTIYREEVQEFPPSLPGQEQLVFTIEADRFLRNMVRAIVGTMVDIGRGKREPEYIASLLEGGTRSRAGQSVPGHALFLTKIMY